MGGTPSEPWHCFCRHLRLISKVYRYIMRAIASARPAPRLAHSARVATIAAMLVALLYLGVTLPFDILDARHLMAQVDNRVADKLQDVTKSGPPGAAAYDHVPVDNDVDTAPVVFWRAKERGNAIALGAAPSPLTIFNRPE